MHFNPQLLPVVTGQAKLNSSNENGELEEGQDYSNDVQRITEDLRGEGLK